MIPHNRTGTTSLPAHRAVKASSSAVGLRPNMQDCDISITKTCSLMQLLFMHLNEVNRANLARQEYGAGRRQIILRSAYRKFGGLP
jgi:hypothetical protein